MIFVQFFNNSLIPCHFFYILYVFIKKIKVILLLTKTRKSDDFISIRFVLATISSFI